MQLPIIISKTARQFCQPEDRFKYVSYLTREEISHVRNGTAIVAFLSNYQSRWSGGTKWRVLKCGSNNRPEPRIPTLEILKAIEREAAK